MQIIITRKSVWAVGDKEGGMRGGEQQSNRARRGLFHRVGASQRLSLFSLVTFTIWNNITYRSCWTENTSTCLVHVNKITKPFITSFCHNPEDFFMSCCAHWCYSSQPSGLLWCQYRPRSRSPCCSRRRTYKQSWRITTSSLSFGDQVLKRSYYFNIYLPS